VPLIHNCALATEGTNRAGQNQGLFDIFDREFIDCSRLVIGCSKVDKWSYRLVDNYLEFVADNLALPVKENSQSVVVVGVKFVAKEQLFYMLLFEGQL
jgi:hypothetical protein